MSVRFGESTVEDAALQLCSGLGYSVQERSVAWFQPTGVESSTPGKVQEVFHGTKAFAEGSDRAEKGSEIVSSRSGLAPSIFT
jgi:hypothetical protein